MFTSAKHIIPPLLIAAIGLASMSVLTYFLNNGAIPMWSITRYRIVNLTFTLQTMVLGISAVALILTRLCNKSGFIAYFRWNGRANNKWSSLAPMLALVFTISTTALMGIGVMAAHGKMNGTFFSLLPLVLLFAATNAWSEEIFSRFVLIAGLDGKLPPRTICLISGIMFGIPHFWGTPSGIFGVIMSGLLGWVLALTVVDTRGLKWALLIHFLQDVAIFGAGAMIIAGQAL